MPATTAPVPALDLSAEIQAPGEVLSVRPLDEATQARGVEAVRCVLR